MVTPWQWSSSCCDVILWQLVDVETLKHWAWVQAWEKRCRVTMNSRPSEAESAQVSYSLLEPGIEPNSRPAQCQAMPRINSASEWLTKPWLAQPWQHYSHPFLHIHRPRRSDWIHSLFNWFHPHLRISSTITYDQNGTMWHILHSRHIFYSNSSWISEWFFLMVSMRNWKMGEEEESESWVYGRFFKNLGVEKHFKWSSGWGCRLCFDELGWERETSYYQVRT